MKYQVHQISYDNCNFLDIEECTWDFTTSKIHTNKGVLDIHGFLEVEQNGQVGVQMRVDGWLALNEYNPNSSSQNELIYIPTLTIMRQPHNVWLWVYLFNEDNLPVATFCGTDIIDETDGFSRYIKELNRMADGGMPDELEAVGGDDYHYTFNPSAEEKVTDCILADGYKYNGWGFYRNGNFIPHGCGKKFYLDYYVYGNFKEGVLNGPAINSHDYYMYTLFYKNNRGNGWGLCINGGHLIEFGYYEDNKLKTNLTEFVQWYYDGQLCNSERIGENMMSMYTSKETKEVTNLLIGYASKKITENIILACMGFRFKADGSVWVGTSKLTNTMTGHYIHFRPDGCIDIGKFSNSNLEERMSLQEFIDTCFCTHKISEDNPFAALFRNHPKSSRRLEREYEREQYRNIKEPKVEYNYFTGVFE